MTIPPIYAYPSSPDPDIGPFPWYTAIYGLFDPGDGSLHYVGQSMDPDKRRKAHLKKAHSGGAERVNQWIRKVQANSREPILKIIEWAPNDNDSHVAQAEDDHIATALHYGLPLENEDRIGKGDVLPWTSLTQECAELPQYPALFPMPVQVDGVNTYRNFTVQDIAAPLWEHMLLIHGDPGRNYISYKTFIKEDFVSMAATTHPEMQRIANTFVYGRKRDGWLRRNVSVLIQEISETI